MKKDNTKTGDITKFLHFNGVDFLYKGKVVSKSDLKVVTVVFINGEKEELTFHLLENISDVSEMVDLKEIKYVYYSSAYPALQQDRTFEKFNIGYKNDSISVGTWKPEEDDDNEKKFPFSSYSPEIGIGQKHGTNIECDMSCEGCQSNKVCAIKYFVQKGIDPYGYILIPNYKKVVVTKM